MFWRPRRLLRRCWITFRSGASDVVTSTLDEEVLRPIWHSAAERACCDDKSNPQPVLESVDTFGMRGLHKKLLGWQVLSLSSLFSITPSSLYPHICTMSSRRNQSSVIYHYTPSGQNYHIHYAPQAVLPLPAQTGMQPYPPPQVLANDPSSDPRIKSCRPIKPAPVTTPADSSTSPSPNDTSGSQKDAQTPQAKANTPSPQMDPSSQKRYKFVQYTPR